MTQLLLINVKLGLFKSFVYLAHPNSGLHNKSCSPSKKITALCFGPLCHWWHQIWKRKIAKLKILQDNLLPTTKQFTEFKASSNLLLSLWQFSWSFWTGVNTCRFKVIPQKLKLLTDFLKLSLNVLCQALFRKTQ